MSARFFLARFFALLIAATSLVANGAQAHVQMRAADSISVPMCGDGKGQVIHIELGDSSPVDTGHDTCCGKCMVAGVMLPPSPVVPPARMIGYSRYATLFAPAVYPGSPLWPGAPPVGPPSSFKA